MTVRQTAFLSFIVDTSESKLLPAIFFLCAHIEPNAPAADFTIFHIYFCLSRQLWHIRTHPKIQYIISAQQNTVHFWKTFLFRILFLYFVCSGIRRFVFAFVVVLFMVCLRRYKWGSAVVFCASNGTTMANYHFFSCFVVVVACRPSSSWASDTLGTIGQHRLERIFIEWLGRRNSILAIIMMMMMVKK